MSDPRMAEREIRRDLQLPTLTPTIEARFGLMAEPLRFRTNDPLLLAVAERAYGRFAVPADGKPLEVRLLVDAQGPPSTFDPRQLRPRVQGHLHTITLDARNQAVVDLERGIAVGTVSPEVARDADFVRYAFVEAMGLSMLGRARGYVAIHASAVVHRGRAAILQGPAGAGKSTLAMACARLGFGVLAEDVVFTRRAGTEVEVWGAPWIQRLLPDAVDHFAELSGVVPRLQVNGERKIEVDLELLRPGAAQPSAPVGAAILLVRDSGGPTRIEGLGAAEATEAFEVLWPWGDGWSTGHEGIVRTLLAGGVARLHMNGSPEEAAEALTRWLDR
jgi:hypothetical protein